MKRIEITPKVCKRCGQAKSLDEYKVYKNSRSTRCRDCVRELSAIDRESPTIIPRGTKNRKVIAHKIANYVKEQNGCAICGEADPICLLFHHTNGKDKLGTITSLCQQGRVNLLLEEMKRCVVLCANCHARVHIGGLILDTGKKCVVPNIDHLL